MLKFIQDNAGVLGIAIATIPLIIGFVVGVIKFAQYVDVQRRKQRQVEYKNFHELIERLTAPLPGSQNAWLDVQKAAAFELRNYPKYAEITELILTGWIKRGTEMEEVMKGTLMKLGRPYRTKKKQK
jgi:hypothetical protein